MASRIDQRPYVAQTPKTTMGPQFVPDPNDPSRGQILWTFHVTNFGRTPAHALSCKKFYKLAGKPWSRSYLEPPEDVGSVLPQGVEDTYSVVSAPMRKADFEKLLTLSDGITLKAQMFYTDFYGTQYETGICMTRLNMGAIAYCAGHYIK